MLLLKNLSFSENEKIIVFCDIFSFFFLGLSYFFASFKSVIIVYNKICKIFYLSTLINYIVL